MDLPVAGSYAGVVQEPRETPDHLAETVQRESNASGEATRRDRDAMARALKLLADDPLASPMTPDHPGWLDEGESTVTLVPSKPRPEPPS
jgi:hypothetical protein